MTANGLQIGDVPTKSRKLMGTKTNRNNNMDLQSTRHIDQFVCYVPVDFGGAVKFTIMKFNNTKFAQAIITKKFELINKREDFISLRDLSNLIGGVSPAQLSRICNGQKSEIDTILKICTWLKQPITKFID